jgi:hypothetical protein
MNAISGPAQSVAVSQPLTNAPVRPVRRIPPSDERIGDPQADRYEPSTAREAAPQVTYGRNGRGGSASDSGGTSDRTG